VSRVDVLASLGDLPAVVEAGERARAACDELRWHEAFRRRWREVRAEAGVRSACASAAVDGARVPLDVVRAMASTPPDDGATELVARGALRAAALVERLMPELGGKSSSVLPPLPQLVARIHAAAAAGLVGPDDLGRLRGTRAPRDLTGLGAAPTGAELAARLELLGRVVATSEAPALVVAAVVHGELLALRPFVAGNGVVARATARLLVTARGLDVTGSVIAEGAWARTPNAYLGAAAGFATGTPSGVGAWVVACADAVVDGAGAARAVAEAVRAGRLDG